MEQLGKLPQIPISSLQKIIIKRRKAQQYYHKAMPYLNQAVIHGFKPYFCHNRNNKYTNLCQCKLMKCNCKNIEKHAHAKYKYLLKNNNRSTSEISDRRYHTQAIQIVQAENVPKVNRIVTQKNQQSLIKLLSKKRIKNLDKIIPSEFQQINQNKLQQNMKKIEEELIKRMLQKNKYTNVNILRTKVKQFVQNIHERLKKAITQKLNMNKLYKQLQSYLSQSDVISNYSVSKTNDKSKNNKQKKGKNQINKQSNNQKIYANKNMNLLRKDDDQIMDLIGLFLNQNNGKFMQRYLSELAKAEIKEFQQILAKILQIIRCYSNQQKVIKNIGQCFLQLQTKIIQNQDQNKDIKIKCLNKLRDVLPQFQGHSTTNSQFEEFRSKSRKFVQIKKSQKTARIINIEQSDNQNQKEKMSINRSRRSSRSQASTNKLQDFGSRRSFNSVVSAMMGLDNQNIDLVKTNKKIKNSSPRKTLLNVFTQKYNKIKEQQSLEQISQNFEQNVVNFYGQNYVRNSVKRKKFQYQQTKLSSDKIINQSIKKQAYDQRKSNPQSSVFKIEKQQKFRLLKQKYQKQESDIKKFINANKQVAKRGKSILKNGNLSQYIIDQGDSVLTKKIKIRKLKQIVHMVGKQQLIQQLLAYIHVYETECKLILRKDSSRFETQQKQNGTKEQNGKFVIFDKKRYLTQQMKFYKLNNQYFYGQSELYQMAFNPRSHEPGYQLQQLKNLNKQLKSILRLQKNYKINQLSLLQKQLPQMGKFYNCLKTSAIQNKIKIETELPSLVDQNKQKQNKLNNKMKSIVENTKKLNLQYKYSKKFMLTENSICRDL